MRPVWAILSGVCATMTGVGLARFAYGPLLPAIVQAGWVSGGQGGALGAINLGGYLCGAAFAPALARAIGLRWALRLAMLVATVTFLLCAEPGGLAWLSPWRALTGMAGGVLMVLAGPAVQAVVPARMRGLAAGLIFAGVGSGIVIGAVLVPALLPIGLPAAWLALAGFAACLTAISWPLWPDVQAPPAMRLPRLSGDSRLLVVSYACAAAGQAVHMVWWPDFLARGLGHSAGGAAAFWALYGVAAAIGPSLYGALADRIGAARSMRVAMAMQVIGLGLPLLGTADPFLVLSAITAGGTSAGATALALTRAREVGGAAAPGIWRITTMTFGLTQTLTGFGLAWLYTATGGHRALFVAGFVASVAALVTAWRQSPLLQEKML